MARLIRSLPTCICFLVFVMLQQQQLAAADAMVGTETGVRTRTVGAPDSYSLVAENQHVEVEQSKGGALQSIKKTMSNKKVMAGVGASLLLGLILVAGYFFWWRGDKKDGEKDDKDEKKGGKKDENDEGKKEGDKGNGGGDNKKVR